MLKLYGFLFMRSFGPLFSIDSIILCVNFFVVMVTDFVSIM